MSFKPLATKNFLSLVFTLFQSTLLLNLLPSVNAQLAKGEPPGNQILFGIWFDPSHGASDTPTAINHRLGYRVPVYQIAQSIPLPRYNWTTGAGGPAPENLIELSETDAAVFLTIYPNGGLASVAQADLEQLANQILDYQRNLDRTVYLRYAPEMQGLWNNYGFQPAGFVQHWRTMHGIISGIAPDTIFVWAPNMPTGYPWGQSTSALTQPPISLTSAQAALDIAALDTNGDGVVDGSDDALAPYYPGDQYVDWNGVSVYYKGTGTQDFNVAQPGGYCAQIITGINPSTMAEGTDFYTTYCQNKPTIPCMFAESGAAYRPNAPISTQQNTQAEIQNAWLRDCITNSTFMDTFPRLKMLMAFEYEKVEDNNANPPTPEMRDFRMTNATDVLNVLKEDLALPDVSSRFSWANPRARPTSISSAGAPAAETNSNEIDIISATTRGRPTDFPSLFGTSDAKQLFWEMGQVGALAASGILGAWTVIRMI